jgi:catalase (peroxidase I)
MHQLTNTRFTLTRTQGPWTRAPTTFSNLYFTELMNNTWTVKKWDGPKQYEDPTGELMSK